MVALVERACAQLAQDYLALGETTVGVSLQVAHLAPTPVGQEVIVQAELITVAGDRLEFEAQIWDESELVGLTTNGSLLIKSDSCDASSPSKLTFIEFASPNWFG